MGRRITTEYITNCAVLLQCGTDKILVDGIFSGRQPFDVMDAETERDIIEGRGAYEGIKYLLFTHCHNDHYNGSKILQFPEHHSGTVIVVPEKAKLDADRLADKDVAVIRMQEEEMGVIKHLDFGEFQVEYMKTGHLTFRYPEHYCFNVVSEDANVVLTADMNLEALEWMEEFTKKTDSTMFLNNIALWHRKWRTRVEELGYRSVFIYHIPSEENDSWGCRRKALVYWNKKKEELQPLGWSILGISNGE